MKRREFLEAIGAGALVTGGISLPLKADGTVIEPKYGRALLIVSDGGEWIHNCLALHHVEKYDFVCVKKCGKWPQINTGYCCYPANAGNILDEDIIVGVAPESITPGASGWVQISSIELPVPNLVVES